jgi:hypothetical protein
MAAMSHCAPAVPSESAKARRSALKWPMTKRRKVSRAESAGEEKEEKRSATAVMMVSSA